MTDFNEMIRALYKKIDCLKNLYIGNISGLCGEKIIYENDKPSLSECQCKLKGIYCFRLCKNKETMIVYVGKSENDDRVRQHIYGKNKDGSVLKISVKTKYKDIRNAIENGFECRLITIPLEVRKSVLSLIELELISYYESRVNKEFYEKGMWNKRSG